MSRGTTLLIGIHKALPITRTIDNGINRSYLLHSMNTNGSADALGGYSDKFVMLGSHCS
jgi:hypothetical protein